MFVAVCNELELNVYSLISCAIISSCNTLHTLMRNPLRDILNVLFNDRCMKYYVIYTYIYIYIYVCICICVCYICICVYIYIYIHKVCQFLPYIAQAPARGTGAPHSQTGRSLCPACRAAPSGQTIAHQTSTPQKYVRIFSGSFRWMLRGMFRHNSHLSAVCSKGSSLFSSGLATEFSNGCAVAFSKVSYLL